MFYICTIVMPFIVSQCVNKNIIIISRCQVAITSINKTCVRKLSYT